MNSEQHMIMTQYSPSETKHMEGAPLELLISDRAAKRRRLIAGAFFALGCAMIGLQFLIYSAQP